MRGWKALSVLLALIAILTGIGTWAFITWLIPIIIPTGEIWPVGPTGLWMWLCIGGTIAGLFLGFIIDYSPLWTNRLPILSDAGSAASMTGAAAGAAAATASLATAEPADLFAMLTAGAVTVVLSGLAWRKFLSATREARDHNRNIVRINTLHATGTRVRAVVEDVDFQQFWLWNDPVFTVTARYDTPSGPQRSTGRVIMSAADAPIVGGTVLLWFAGDGSDVENTDLRRDPDSIRDPHAAETYQAPPDI